MGLFTIDRTINFEEKKVRNVLEIIYSSENDNEIEDKMLEKQIVKLREDTDRHGFFRRRWTTFLKDFCLYNHPNVTELGKLYMNDLLSTKEITLLVLVRRVVNLNGTLIRPLELIVNVSKMLLEKGLNNEISQIEFENAVSHYGNRYNTIDDIVSIIERMRNDTTFNGEAAVEPCHYDIWKNLLKTAGISTLNNVIKIDCDLPIVKFIISYFEETTAIEINNDDFNDPFIRYIKFPTLISENGEVKYERTQYKEYYPSIVYNYLFNMSINKIETEILKQNQHGTIPFRILNGFNISTNVSDDVRNKEIYSCFKGYENIIIQKLRNTNNKTYKFIADQISTFLLATYEDDEDLSMIEKFKRFYRDNIDQIKEKESIVPQELKTEFLEEYPIERFKTMSLEEYSLGLDNSETFCRLVEHGKYKKYGASCGMDPNGAKHWGIYYSNKGMYLDKDNNEIDNLDQYWEHFRNQLYDYLKNLEDENPIFSNHYPMLSNMTKTLPKLCFMYYPKKFLNIVSKGVLQEISKIFELDFDRDASADELSYHLNKYIRDLIPESQNELTEIVSSVILAFKEEQLEEINDVERLKNGCNIIYYGSPGCGKSHKVKKIYCSDDDKYERITFHQEYTNSDFIGQIRPVVENDVIKYDFVIGPFTRILKKAFTPGNEKNMYYLIIEELNRGNAPAIFGDIFQLLDREKETANSEYPIDNDDLSKAIFGVTGKKIYIPGNVSIIATMNSNDQNVFVLDTAFKRRWEWIKISNKFTDKDDEYTTKLAKMFIPGIDKTWESFLNTINNEILDEKYGSNGEDKQLGIYFVDDKILSVEQTSNDVNKRKFAEKVFMYLWEDVVKYDRDGMFKNYKTLDSLVDDFMKIGLAVFQNDIFSDEDNINA